MPQRDAPITPDQELIGIGGWLTIPVIGLMLAPIMGVSLIVGYAGFGGMMQHLSGLQSLFLIFEIFGNFVILFVLPILLITMLFKNKRIFPRAFIVYLVFAFVFSASSLIIAHFLFPKIHTHITMVTLRELFFQAIHIVIWIPYMLKSRRVKNTFVH